MGLVSDCKVPFSGETCSLTMEETSRWKVGKLALPGRASRMASVWTVWDPELRSLSRLRRRTYGNSVRGDTYSAKEEI
jgi:hypothetical protein